eukprot:3848410-Pleurochrysis_carterae.AAC.1
MLPKLVHRKQRVRECGHASDILQYEVDEGAAGVECAQRQIPDDSTGLCASVHARDAVGAWPCVHKIFASRMNVPGAATVDNKGYARESRRQSARSRCGVAAVAGREQYSCACCRRSRR